MLCVSAMLAALRSRGKGRRKERAVAPAPPVEVSQDPGDRLPMQFPMFVVRIPDFLGMTEVGRPPTCGHVARPTPVTWGGIVGPGQAERPPGSGKTACLCPTFARFCRVEPIRFPKHRHRRKRPSLSCIGFLFLFTIARLLGRCSLAPSARIPGGRCVLASSVRTPAPLGRCVLGTRTYTCPYVRYSTLRSTTLESAHQPFGQVCARPFGAHTHTPALWTGVRPAYVGSILFPPGSMISTSRVASLARALSTLEQWALGCYALASPGHPRRPLPEARSLRGSMRPLLRHHPDNCRCLRHALSELRLWGRCAHACRRAQRENGACEPRRKPFGHVPAPAPCPHRPRCHPGPS